MLFAPLPLPMLKSLSSTRWSCRGYSTRVLWKLRWNKSGLTDIGIRQRGATGHTAWARCVIWQAWEAGDCADDHILGHCATLIQAYKQRLAKEGHGPNDHCAPFGMAAHLRCITTRTTFQLRHRPGLSRVWQTYQYETHHVSKRRTFDDEAVDNEVILGVESSKPRHSVWLLTACSQDWAIGWMPTAT